MGNKEIIIPCCPFFQLYIKNAQYEPYILICAAVRIFFSVSNEIKKHHNIRWEDEKHQTCNGIQTDDLDDAGGCIIRDDPDDAVDRRKLGF